MITLALKFLVPSSSSLSKCNRHVWSRCRLGNILVKSGRLPIPFRHYSGYMSEDASPGDGALTGVRVLDLSRVLAGPFSTQILGDYGADIIKVEDIGRGDDTRHWKTAGEDQQWKSDVGPISNYFAAVNRNKRSISLDLKQSEGLKAFLSLVSEVDVLVENMRPGTTERLGIDYETVRKVKPGIIYASISGYGPSGPFAQRAGYDMIAGAEAGMLHLTGERNGPPVRPGLGITDMSTGLFLHGAIMAALYARKLTGRGQKIDASLFESQIALLTNVATTWLNMGQEAQRWGTQHPSIVPYDAFKSKDLYFVCGATNDKQFLVLCDVLKLVDLPKDPRFITNAARVEHRDALSTILNEAFAKKTAEEWTNAFEGTGLPYGVINTMAKVFSHPQTHARGMVHEMNFESTKSENLTVLGPAVKFSDTPSKIRRKPPLLGEHSKEILREIGYTEVKIAELSRKKVIPN